MTSPRFDRLAMMLTSRVSRRTALRTVGIGAAGLASTYASAATVQDASPVASPEDLSGPCLTGTRDETADVAQQYLDIFTSHDLDLYDELADPGVVHHWGQGVDTTGIEELKASSEAFFTAFPDMVITFDEVVVENAMVVIRWTLNGTQTGQFFEIAPTGIEATWTGINMYRISGGKVVEVWGEADGVGLRQQLQAPGSLATPAT